MGRSTPMDHAAADRIGAAADRDPQSPTARAGFDERAADGLHVWPDAPSAALDVDCPPPARPTCRTMVATSSKDIRLGGQILCLSPECAQHGHDSEVAGVYDAPAFDRP